MSRTLVRKSPVFHFLKHTHNSLVAANDNLIRIMERLGHDATTKRFYLNAAKAQKRGFSEV
ncbi:hypothetical protein [Sporolactobacillus pectinivorans]|uniref:hypothetical protein n=1 Tax=Sporolactobacillus pectinivorans TaxID=1591408 RepID=UPI000C25EBEE|nr:hypothetical protein [Sporolactobacillus pectinivorans]